MTDLPDDLRDRAARAAREAYGRSAPSLSGVNLDRWLVVVDAVAGVLAGHLAKTCGCWDRHAAEANDLRAENSDLRARAERAEARTTFELHTGGTDLRGREMQCGCGEKRLGRGVLEFVNSRGDRHRKGAPCEALSGPVGAAHTEEET